MRREFTQVEWEHTFIGGCPVGGAAHYMGGESTKLGYIEGVHPLLWETLECALSFKIVEEMLEILMCSSKLVRLDTKKLTCFT